MVLESGKSKIMALAGLVSGEGPFPPFPGSQLAVFSLGLHVVEGAMEFSGVSYRALIPSCGLHPHDLITSQWCPLLIPLYWALGFQHEFQGDTLNIQFITVSQDRGPQGCG